MLDPIRRQLLQRLADFQHAGIDFLPRVDGPPPDFGFDESASERVPEDTGESTTHPDRRRLELQQIAQRVSQCVRCPELASTRTQTVFGVGPLDAELCFVGEAPGADEDRTGEPFVGEAGKLLDRIIAAMGLKREEIYICNVLRCRPPGNRTPKPDEIENCREYLEGQLDLIRPKFICALGLPAAQTILRNKLSLVKMRGQFHNYKGIPVICTYHPAYLLPHRFPENKKLVWDDMKMLLQKMGRPIPSSGANKPAS